MLIKLITLNVFCARCAAEEFFKAEREVNYKHLIFVFLVGALMISTIAGMRTTAAENRALVVARADAEAEMQSDMCVAGRNIGLSPEAVADSRKRPAPEGELERQGVYCVPGRNAGRR